MVTAVPTFECIGLYWKAPEGGGGQVCEATYRVTGNQEWAQALPLWFDGRNEEYRGSIVNLQPDTRYEISLQLRGTQTRASVQARTWSEAFPLGRRIELPPRSDKTLTVADSGSPDEFVVYEGAGNSPAVIDVAGKADYCILLKASHVILRGLTLKGARVHAIMLGEAVHDVVIEGCDISGWGRIAEDGWGKDYDAAIYSKHPGVKRIIVQRNRIHHPRSNSNNWQQERPGPGKQEPSHPEGPQAVCLWDSEGNHVIRYNTVFSDGDHQYNDIFGAGHNFSTRGFPNRDSDIYGNLLSHCWDDAIESEGANCNVRIWGNYITEAFVGVACASTSIGPLYVWRNVTGVIRESPTKIAGAFLKTSNKTGGGRIYVFHNTVLQPPSAADPNKTSGAVVGLGWGGPMTNVTSRNNILEVTRQVIADRAHDPLGDYDYDLFSLPLTTAETQEKHGVRGKPGYVPGSGLKEGRGTFALAPTSPGFDRGEVVPNFNDGFAGAGPDNGAQEAGAPPMEFGVQAYQNRTAKQPGTSLRASQRTAASAAENLLQDGGFEQFLSEPDEQGNPFKAWAGWKWEGNCRRVADTRFKHDGQASGSMLSYGPCKLGISQTVQTAAGWYRLSGWVRAVDLKPGLYERGLVVSFESHGAELMTELPKGTYGWRPFELTQRFDTPAEKNLLYIYLFGSGKIWLDELRLEKLDGADLKSGLVMGAPEESLQPFTGASGIACSFCGFKVDPTAAVCGICGEPISGMAGFTQANQTFAKLTALMDKAKAKGLDVLYWQAAAIPMRVGLNERWKSFPEERPEALRYVEKRGQELINEINLSLGGELKPRVAPPKPDFTRMKLKGRSFCEGDVPTLFYSVHSGPAKEAEPFFSSHSSWVSTCMAPGADRFNYKQMPIWDAFNKYPDTHRIYDGGWCGHIIADKWSGGVSGANCVICLESPHTREACAEAYRKVLPGEMRRNTRLISLLDYEYYYICYCERTRDMFRSWLKDKFGNIGKLNECWGTHHQDFVEIELPDFRKREPNDAKRYDWLDFNLWRFVDFLKWAKAQQRQIDPGIPMATCAPHYNFTKEWGESGSDVEALTEQVNDFCLNESPASTKYVDFLRSLSGNQKAIVEIEGSEYRNTMAQFLHGLSCLSLYWAWDDKPGDGGALLYGRGSRPPYCSLPEAECFLRTGLDIRRLRQEILAFQQDIKAPVALLYSKASLLQVPAGGGDKTPYLLELDRSYDALLELGVPVDFITTKQVLAGKLSQYRVLVIPAATYEQAEVVQKVMSFARSGGEVVLVPNSWFFDQYNRPQDYLGPLNLAVTSMKAPRISAGQAKTGLQRDTGGEETEAPFLMGLMVDSVVTEIPKARLATTRSTIFGEKTELQGAGVRHVFKTGGKNRVLATFPDGQPALVQVPVEKGAIYYLGIPLVRESMVQLMEGVLASCGAQGPVRVLGPAGKHVPDLEYRAIKFGNGWLAYVNNLDRKRNQQVQLAAEFKFDTIRNLTLESDVTPAFTIPAGETYILKIK